VPIVAALDRHPAIKLVAVVTAPQRGAAPDPRTDPPIVGWANQRGMALLRPPRLRDPVAVDYIGRDAPSLLVLADYGQIVPVELLNLPRYGALNVHPSLLPRHRGASPIPAAILAGDAETGVTIIRMDAGLDTGPIVAQRRTSVTGAETAPELEARLAALGADMLLEILTPWLTGRITPAPQLTDGATMTRPLSREDGRLDPVRGVSQLYRQVRAYQPWPGTFLETVAGRVIVRDARPLAGSAALRPGTLIALPPNRVALAASDGLLELLDVQPAGGRRMTGAELLRGRPILSGSIVSSPSDADDRA
jgi:methionyl-tRNA formyltransferase